MSNSLQEGTMREPTWVHVRSNLDRNIPEQSDQGVADMPKPWHVEKPLVALLSGLLPLPW